MGSRNPLDLALAFVLCALVAGCGFWDPKWIRHPITPAVQTTPMSLPGPSPQYTFKVESFDIKTLRSAHLDTDIITLTIRVGETTYGPITKAMGDVEAPDVKKGADAGVINCPEVPPPGQTVAKCSHYPINDVQIGPISGIGKNTSVTIDYRIMNSGHGSYDEMQQLVTQMITGAGVVGSATNPAFGGAALAIDYGQGLLFANCDGPVAIGVAEKVSHLGKVLLGNPQVNDLPVQLLTGETLSSLTSAGNTYTQTDHYNLPSNIKSTPSGCGANSDYFVTWSIMKF